MRSIYVCLLNLINIIYGPGASSCILGTLCDLGATLIWVKLTFYCFIYLSMRDTSTAMFIYLNQLSLCSDPYICSIEIDIIIINMYFGFCDIFGLFMVKRDLPQIYVDKIENE